MKEQDIQLAIAKATGWHCDNITWFSPSGSCNACHKQDGTIIPDSDILPDYLHNRDEMVAALLTLTGAKRCMFGEWVAVKVGAYEDHYEGWTEIGPLMFFDLVATLPLPVMAEGFLRARGLWRDVE